MSTWQLVEHHFLIPFQFSSNPNFNAVPPGTYTVTVKDNNGCTYTETVTIGNAPGPTGPRATGVKSNCSLPNGSVTLQTPLTGTGPYTYAFNNNGSSFSTTTSYTNLLAGTYTYIVKDPFGCPLTGTIVVGNNAGPSALTVNTTNAICGNPTGGLTILAPTTGASPFSYSVSTITPSFTTTTNYTSVSPAIYTVTVRDANTCTYSVTANVDNLPGPTDVSLSTTNSTCGNATGSITIGAVTGGTLPFTYSVNTVSVAYNSTTNYSSLAPTTYTVNVKDANGCIFTKTVAVNNTSGPTAVATTTTAATCGNNNGSISIGAVTGGVAAYTYSVSGVSASFSPTTSYTGLSNGTYTVSVRDANACTFTVSVNVPSAPASTSVALTTTNSTCGNANGIINIGAVTGGTSPFTYSVSGLSGSYSSTTVYNNASAITYTVFVRDANGCIFSRTVAVSNTAGPTNVALSSTNSTCGNANGVITIGAVTGGTSPFTCNAK